MCIRDSHGIIFTLVVDLRVNLYCVFLDMLVGGWMVIDSETGQYKLKATQLKNIRGVECNVVYRLLGTLRQGGAWYAGAVSEFHPRSAEHNR